MVAEAFSAVSATLSSIGTAFNLAKSLHSGAIDAAAKEKIADIQTALMDAQSRAVEAQSGQSALIEEINRLKAKISEIETWEAEKKRYVFHEPKSGVHTYILKDRPESSEHPMQFCANCYQDRQISILQQIDHSHPRAVSLLCPRCRTELFVQGSPPKGRGRAGAL